MYREFGFATPACAGESYVYSGIFLSAKDVGTCSYEKEKWSLTLFGDMYKNHHFGPRNFSLCFEEFDAIKRLLLGTLRGLYVEVELLHQRQDHTVWAWPPRLGVNTFLSHNSCNVRKFTA